MANNYIAINQQQRHGNALYNATCLLADSRDRLTQLKNDMDNMVVASDYSVVEGAFGLATGKGTILYNLVAGAVAELAADTNAVNLINWVGVVR